MRLGSMYSSFVYNLPSNFIKPEVIESYTPLLEHMHIQYSNVLDYLNSTIKTVTYPGLSFETPTQTRTRGKVQYHKPAINVQDIVSGHEINVTFRSVDSDINFWLLQDIFYKHYIDVENKYIEPFRLSVVDIFRNEIYTIAFYDIIMFSMSDIMFDYSRQKISEKEFTIGFKFNRKEIEFTLDKHKVMEQKFVKQIVNKR